MRLAGHQPNYLPNLAFFQKMAQADLFVVLTNVQFERHEGWQQRNRIERAGAPVWLTVPVVGSSRQYIKDARINNSLPWRRKHQRTLQLTYAHTPEPAFLHDLLAVYDQSWDFLADLNFRLIQLIRDVLGIRGALLRDDDTGGEKEALLIALCRKYGADTYLSGAGARSYLTADRLAALADAGLQHQFVPPAGPHPYSAIHEILRDGARATAARLRGAPPPITAR